MLAKIIQIQKSTLIFCADPNQSLAGTWPDGICAKTPCHDMIKPQWLGLSQAELRLMMP